jgi:hypothetical protein
MADRGIYGRVSGVQAGNMATRKKPVKRPFKVRNPIARVLRAVGLFGQRVVVDKRKKAARKVPKWRQTSED